MTYPIIKNLETQSLLIPSILISFFSFRFLDLSPSVLPNPNPSAVFPDHHHHAPEGQVSPLGAPIRPRASLIHLAHHTCYTESPVTPNPLTCLYLLEGSSPARTPSTDYLAQCLYIASSHFSAATVEENLSPLPLNCFSFQRAGTILLLGQNFKNEGSLETGQGEPLKHRKRKPRMTDLHEITSSPLF